MRQSPSIDVGFVVRWIAHLFVRGVSISVRIADWAQSAVSILVEVRKSKQIRNLKSAIRN
jgi:hypothetical protein